MSAAFSSAPLQIITADERMRERRGIKGVLTGISGIGKTSQLWTLNPDTTLFINLEAGALADEVEGKKVRKSVIADPRNPVIGTRLVREWNGAEHVITVLKDGFDWQGRRYKSLSAIARDITGTQWNGYRFFGLRERKDAA